MIARVSLSPLKIARWGIAALVLPALLAGCSALADTEHATPYPTEYLPTVVALTLGASAGVRTPPSETTGEYTHTPAPTTTIPASQMPPPATHTSQPVETATPLVSSPTAVPVDRTASPTSAAPLDIPDALLMIRNLGPLSRVTSPLHLSAYVKTGASGRVLIELLGEDNRLLFRELKTISTVPVGGSAGFSMDLEFEISAAAEAGRLRLSIADEYDRTTAVNSVPLILLSIGDSDIIPPVDVLAPIDIQQPTRRALIQGGKVLVSGLARSGGLGTLMVKLLTTNGSEVGSRLVGVQTPTAGGHGSFAIEVPYTVSQPTTVLLVVQEGAQSINDPIYLTSLEVMLSP